MNRTASLLVLMLLLSSFPLALELPFETSVVARAQGASFGDLKASLGSGDLRIFGVDYYSDKPFAAPTFFSNGEEEKTAGVLQGVYGHGNVKANGGNGAAYCDTILKPALETLTKNPALIGTMTTFVAKNGDDAVESTRSYIKVLGLGAETEKTTMGIIEKFGTLTAKQTESLGRAVKGLDAHNWSDIEKNGLHALIKNAPQGQGDAVLVAMKKSEEWTDDLVKQATEFDEVGDLKNIKFEQKLPNSEKNVDWKINLKGQEYWIDSTGITDELINPQNLYGKLLSDSRRTKFESLGAGGIQVIGLEKGTSLTKMQIESVIKEALPQMPGTSKIKVYNAINGEVFWG